MTTVNDHSEVDERRREALARICAESAQLRLPMPMTIDFSDDPAQYSSTGISLRLDEGQRDGVLAWASHLRADIEVERAYTEPADRVRGRAWVSVGAKLSGHDGPVWLDYEYVEVWCSCPVPGDAEGGESL